MKNKLFTLLVCLGIILCLWGIAELGLHAYMQMGATVAMLLVLIVLLLFVAALGALSGLVVDSIMKNYEDPYGN